MVYTIQCAWCGKHIGIKEAPGNGITTSMEQMGLPIISHGMCEKCKREILEEMRSQDSGGENNGLV